MAIIPRVNPGEIAQISPAPQVRNTAEVRPVQGLAAVGEQLGGIAQKWHQEAVERNDTTAVLAARRQLSDWEAKTFDPANPDGISKFQGGNALGADEALLPDLDQHVAQISASLTPRQRAAFDQVATSFRDSVQGRLTQHMTAQHEVFLQAQDKATTDTLLNDATTAALGGDYATGLKRLGEGSSALRLSLAHRGMPEAAIANAERAYVSSYHAGILDGLLARDPAQAQGYLADHQDQFTADDRLKVERVIGPVVAADNARTLADTWIKGGASPALAVPVEGAAKTEAEAEAIARASVERTVGLESGGKADARNPASSATGAAQFTEGTWLDVISRHRPDLTAGKSRAQVLALRTDPALAKEMATAYAVENCRGLFEAGLPVTPETAYLCHHFGLADARNILRADPATPIAQVIAPASYAANSYLKGKTVAEVLGNHAVRAGEGAAPAVTATGQPDWTALFERANALPNPTARQATLAEISRRKTLADSARAQQDRDMLDGIYSAAYAAPVGQPPDKYLSPAQLAWAQRENRVEQLVAIQKRRAEDQLVQTDPVIADALYRESVENPDGFAKRNLLEYGEKLDTQDLASLKARQAALAKGDTRGHADWSSDQQRIQTILRTLGQGQVKASDPKAAAVGSAYRQALGALTESLDGKAPTPAQKDALMQQVQLGLARRIGEHGGWQGVIDQQNAGDRLAGAGDARKVAERFRARYGREPTYAEINAVLRSAYLNQQKGL